MDAPAPRFTLSPEQGFGRSAVRCSLVTMGLNARDFRPEQRNAFIEFVLGIGSEILGGELARGIASGAREVAIFH